MISFATTNWREIKFINVIPLSTATVKLVNIATTKQIYETHFDIIITDYLELESANPTSAKVKDILPNKKITDAYLTYFQFYVEREEGKAIKGKAIKEEAIKGKVLNSKISVSEIKDIGGVVAKVNGWMLNEKYSKINKRLVFSHSNKSTVFIAIDTEKGDFEVHNSNKNDNHLGAISFDGEKTEKSKKHKLKFEY